MVVRGFVRNGVVVLSEGAHLPEGQEVTVLASDTLAGVAGSPDSGAHSILDIPVVSLGAIRHPLTSEDDLLGEMLEGRP